MDLWFKMRIESLHESPSAFMASPEIEIAQGVESFRERIASGGDENILVGGFDGDQIVGSVGLYRETTPKARHKGTIWGMYVRPEYRGRALGRQLLQAAIEFARVTMKLKKVDLSVDASREPAKRLYASLGFKKWGHEELAVCVEGRFFDEEYMSLFFE
jgi:ribosomal protein S18 acetylase RimI-like enzyme